MDDFLSCLPQPSLAWLDIQTIAAVVLYLSAVIAILALCTVVERLEIVCKRTRVSLERQRGLMNTGAVTTSDSPGLTHPSRRNDTDEVNG